VVGVFFYPGRSALAVYDGAQYMVL